MEVTVWTWISKLKSVRRAGILWPFTIDLCYSAWFWLDRNNLLAENESLSIESRKVDID